MKPQNKTCDPEGVAPVREDVLRRTGRFTKDLESELHKFRVLYDLAIAMTTEQALDENLQLVVDECRTLLNCDISYIALLDESRGDFYKHSSSGIRSQTFKQTRLPLGRGLGGLVTRERKGCIVADYGSEEGLDWPVREVAAEEGLVSGMAAPLQMHDRNLGVLYVFSRCPREFTSSDLDTLTLIANLAAVEIARKQVEGKLRESDERFRFMAETTGDVIYRLRYDSMEYDYLSPGIQRLTGYSQEEIAAIGFGSLVVRIDQPHRENVAAEDLIEDRRRGRTGEYRADYLIQTREGVTRWLRDHSFPWFDSSGENVGSVGILSDVSEYKRAEVLVRERTADLVESEEKYRTLVENVPLVVYRMTPDGRVAFVNSFVEEVFGYSPLEILSNSRIWTDVIYEEDRSRIAELRARCISQGAELVSEYRIVHKEGRIVHVIDHAIPLCSSGGIVKSMDGTIIDITGRVKLQEQIVRSEGLKTVGEVSARLAHEIRNPLVSAGGFARRLLSSMKPDDPNRARVEIILKEVGRLESILRTILNYIQPFELEMTPSDINSVTLGALGELRTLLQSRNIQLEVQLEQDLVQVMCDRRQMCKVVETLLTNAVQQMDSPGDLSLETSADSEGVSLVLVYPCRRLSSDDVEHFFYPFTTFQMGHQAADLPLCKAIVSKHGGTLEACMSKPGEISIRLTLPLCQFSDI
jgi:PAS domain S-box-containing protein